jgi:hypothetical protein
MSISASSSSVNPIPEANLCAARRAAPTCDSSLISCE